MPKGGAARPHRTVKKSSSRKIHRKNSTSRNNRYNREATALRLELQQNVLERKAKRVNQTLNKIRRGLVSPSAIKHFENEQKKNNDLANLFSKMR
jgi:hypothetical protein